MEQSELHTTASASPQHEDAARPGNIVKQLNSISVLLVTDKAGRTIINIPLWVVLVILFLFLRSRRKRTTRHR